MRFFARRGLLDWRLDYSLRSCLSASSSSTSASATAPSPAATFAAQLWQHNARGEHKKCTAAFKSSRASLRSDSVIHAAMSAYSFLKQPSQARQLLPLLEQRAHAETTIKSLDILLVGYSRTDRLDVVEGILYEWLTRVGTPNATARSLLVALGLSRRDKNSSELAKHLNLECLEQKQGATNVLPSLTALAAVSRMYAGRFAFEQCLVILDAGIAESKSLAAPISAANAADLARLHHYATRALCDAGRFEAALGVIARLRGNALLKDHVGHVHLLTHLLKYYRHHDGGLNVDRAQLDALLASVDDEDGGARTGLSAAFVGLLCLRGRPTEAEAIMRTAAEAGELRSSAIAMVINSYGKCGQWTEAEALFWSMQEHLPMASRQGRLAYHHVCEAMREAKQHQALAYFIQRSSSRRL